jgi:thioredoxin reductase (NADPH)
MAEVENVIIVGSGPAGYTAALYTSRANLKPLVIEGFLWGGLLQQTTDVENYPGYPEGVMGPAMMQQFRDQAERFGTRFITDQATRVELATEPGGVHRVFVGDDEYQARTIVLAMGAEHRKLAVVGEEELSGRGVSYCATCDAAFFKDKQTIIVGGGDSAMEEAIFLAKFSSKVTIVHRREEFRASKIMLERARAIGNIEWLTPYVVEEFVAGGSGALGHARLRNVETGEERELPMDGAFIAVGHEPQSQLVSGVIDTDDEGYVITQGKSTRTNLPGVFAAGDLVDHTYRQAVTAAGSGCQAALDAEWYMRDTPEVPTPEGMPEGDLAEAQWAPSAAPVVPAAPAAPPAA